MKHKPINLNYMVLQEEDLICAGIDPNKLNTKDWERLGERLSEHLAQDWSEIINILYEEIKE